jgi:surface antigen
MKHYFRSFSVAITLIALLTSGCAQTTGKKEQVGTVMGAAAGGLIGSQFGGSTNERIAGSIIGAVLGGLIGNRIGAALDEEDRKRLAEITRQSAASGGVRSFKNSKTGVSAKTRVVSSSTSASGQVCRTIEQEVVTRDGTLLKDQVTACRTENGWVV